MQIKFTGKVADVAGNIIYRRVSGDFRLQRGGTPCWDGLLRVESNESPQQFRGKIIADGGWSLAALGNRIPSGTRTIEFAGAGALPEGM